MPVEENAQSTLKLLSQLPATEAGETAVQGGVVQQRLGLAPEDINEAVALLIQRGLGRTYKLVGTGVFNFYTVSPTVAGRAAVDPSLERDAQRLARLPGFQRPDPTTGEVSMTASRIREQTGLSIARTNWVVEFLRRSGYVSVGSAAGIAPYTFRDVTLTLAGRSYVNRLAVELHDRSSASIVPQRVSSAAARTLKVVPNDSLREQACLDVDSAMNALASMEGTALERDFVITLLSYQLQSAVDSLRVETNDAAALVRARDEINAAVRQIRRAQPVFARNQKDAIAKVLQTAVTSIGQALAA